MKRHNIMCSTTIVMVLTRPVDTDEALVLVIEKFGTAKHKASNDAAHDAENDLQQHNQRAQQTQLAK